MSIDLTDREKDNLVKFWEAFNARNNPLLDDPWTPSFGHYPPTLELREPANLIFTDEEDPAGCPDPHYYATNGTAPPQESQDDDSITIRGVVYLTLFLAFLAVVVMLLAPCFWRC